MRKGLKINMISRPLQLVENHALTMITNRYNYCNNNSIIYLFRHYHELCCTWPNSWINMLNHRFLACNLTKHPRAGQLMTSADYHFWQNLHLHTVTYLVKQGSTNCWIHSPTDQHLRWISAWLGTVSLVSMNLDLPHSCKGLNINTIYILNASRFHL